MMEDAKRPFLQFPWCAKLLSDPGLTVEIAPSLGRKPGREDDFFASTLHNEAALSNFLLTYKTPDSATAPIEEVTTLVQLGEGVNGFPKTVHGGMVASILDETLGFLIVLNILRGVFPRAHAMTAHLNVTFLKPAPTPGTYMCKVNIQKSEGRKVFVAGVLMDGKGNPLAKGEALFVFVKGAQL